MTTTTAVAVANDEAEGPAASPEETRQSARGTWNLGTRHVVEATRDYPEAAREQIRWFFQWCVGQGIAMPEAAGAIGFSKNALYKAMTGRYEASLDNMAQAIASWRKTAVARAELTRPDFVMTATARKVFQICEAAHLYQVVGKVWGDSQIGKTTALAEYQARNNHGRTILVRMPAGVTLSTFLKALARPLNESAKGSAEKLRHNLFKAVDSNMLVIVDEVHQAFTTSYGGSGLRVLEILRELHDEKGCGMVLCGTNTARDAIRAGDHRKLLEQLDRRGIFELQLPKVATWPDREAIARHFGLGRPEGAARELVDDIVLRWGLKALVTYLQAGRRLAGSKGEEFAWPHFLRAHKAIKDLSNPAGE